MILVEKVLPKKDNSKHMLKLFMKEQKNINVIYVEKVLDKLEISKFT